MRLLSVQEAAALLNVSDEYVTGLLDAGELTAVAGGYLLEEAVEAYRAADDVRRRRAIDDLAVLGQEQEGGP